MGIDSLLVVGSSLTLLNSICIVFMLLNITAAVTPMKTIFLEHDSSCAHQKRLCVTPGAHCAQLGAMSCFSVFHRRGNVKASCC